MIEWQPPWKALRSDSENRLNAAHNDATSFTMRRLLDKNRVESWGAIQLDMRVHTRTQSHTQIYWHTNAHTERRTAKRVFCIFRRQLRCRRRPQEHCTYTAARMWRVTDFPRFAFPAQQNGGWVCFGSVGVCA